MTAKRKSPRFSRKILSSLLPEKDREFLLEEYTEYFEELVETEGHIAAKRWYRKQIVISAPSYLKHTIRGNFIMLKNYFKTGLRSIKSQKVYSFINVAGLAVGLSAFMFISLWVMNQLSYDDFHANSNAIYRVIAKQTLADQVNHSTRTPGPLGSILADSFNEVEQYARHAWTGERVVKSGGNVYYESLIACVDPAFLTMFTFSMVKGDLLHVLDDPFSIVITEKMAEKYFGSEDPLGRTLSMGSRFEFTVTGVLKNLPKNSHLQFDMLIPFETIATFGWDITTWDYSFFTTYIQLKEGFEYLQLEQKLSPVAANYPEESDVSLLLQPLDEIHLYSNFDITGNAGGALYLYVFSFIGLLILVMACINFMNLATARSDQRSKEIGLRKVVGAGRSHIVRQFLAEAVLIAFIALLISPFILFLCLDEFNRITGQTFTLSHFFQADMISIYVGITLLTGLFAGSYPAMMLSSFSPVMILSNRVKTGTASIMRKILVTSQLAISVGLTIFAYAVFMQVDFLKNKDLGFSTDNIMSISLGISNFDNEVTYKMLKDDLAQYPQIKSVAGSFTHPIWFGTIADSVSYNNARLDEMTRVNISSVDFEFIETMGIKLISGRSFSKDFGTDRGSILVNEAFEKLMNIDSALDQVLTIGSSYEGKIVGVMKDFHIASVADAVIAPLIIFQNPRVNNIFIQPNSDDIAATVSIIESSWKELFPDKPFKYDFLDNEMKMQFEESENISTVIKYSTILAGFIALLGIVGLTSYSTAKRAKEIAIRKVAGSGSLQVTSLLCKSILKFILAANILAWPISYYLLGKWLDSFAYKIEISLNMFIISGIVTTVIAVLSVAVQSFKAARANPVDALRGE